MERFHPIISSDLHNAILQTIAYADVFDYPLTPNEIHRYLVGRHANRDEVEQALREGSLFHASEGYYILPNREGLIPVRLKREKTAAKMWPQALGYGQVIAHLPFVRMVAITGSLAMNNVNGNPDIDYFIVSARGRLWMTRAMVLAITRVAAVQGIRLCPNYLVTEDALAFPNQTLYAAHELAQMVPVFGMDVYERICRHNSWKDQFLPNAQGLPPTMDRVKIRASRPVLKSLFEKVLGTPPGEWFEHWEMQRKIRKLSREQRDSAESCFAADYCKGHNLQHGLRTERVYRERLEHLCAEAAYLEVTRLGVSRQGAFR